MRLEDLDDTEIEYELDDWYRLWDDLVNGYYYTNTGVKREVSDWWKVNYEQLFNLPSHYGMIVEHATPNQLKYIKILAIKYNATIEITPTNVHILLPEDDIV